MGFVIAVLLPSGSAVTGPAMVQAKGLIAVAGMALSASRAAQLASDSIIRDEHAGLTAAARKVLPEVKQQRCTVHLCRNVMSNVPKRHQKRLGREVVKVLHAATVADAKRSLKQFRHEFATLDSEAYLRDLFRVRPHWPQGRYLELAPKFWRATRERLDAAQLEAVNS